VADARDSFDSPFATEGVVRAELSPPDDLRGHALGTQVLPRAVLLGLSADVGLELTHVLAYGRCLELVLRMHLRGPVEHPEQFGRQVALGPERTPREVPPSALKFGVRYADGQLLVDRTNRYMARYGSGESSLRLVAAGTSGEFWQAVYVTSSVPARGDVEVIAEWPSRGIGLTRHVLDGARVQRCIAEAHDVWPG
jgi:hypothetical protein